METLIPIIANILAPAVIDFLFGSDDEEGQGYKKGGNEIVKYQGDLAKFGFPRLEKSLEYLFANNFPDVYKLILEKREQLNNSNKMIQGYGSRHKKSGVGYRYPSLEGQPREVAYEYETKKGKRKKTFPVPTEEFMEVYMLNKKRAASNPWIEFLQTKMPELKKEYRSFKKMPIVEELENIEEIEEAKKEARKPMSEELQKRVSELYKKELEKKERKKKRAKGYISSTISEGKGLSKNRKEFIEKYIPEELKNMSYEDLKKRYHERYKKK
jgi:hypothetical protein